MLIGKRTHCFSYSLQFAILDFVLWVFYVFRNPYRICRKYFHKRGESFIYAYGETPLSSFALIAELAELRKEDLFLDLGCGRGRICFWARTEIGCKTIGIDWVPFFIRKACAIVNIFKIQHLDFFCARMTHVAYSKASVVYLYTFHSDEELLDFSALPSKARVITVSEPLHQQGFTLKRSRMVHFSWGKCEVFINEKF
jgi:SAM-dependent methyltransferase